jgi:hypothetical protein
VQPLYSFSAFYGTRIFITVFTRARPRQSTTPNPISKRSTLMLFIHLCLGLPSGLFRSGFPTNNLYAFFSPIRATCPTQVILLQLIILILIDEYKDHPRPINVLYFRIRSNRTKLNFAMKSNPVLTDIIIPNDPCHSYENTFPVINGHTNRVHAYQKKQRKGTECKQQICSPENEMGHFYV